MLNRKYFPFQRNNYYYGKLLTARDFEDEQRYYNDKRRLSNRLTGADGSSPASGSSGPTTSRWSSRPAVRTTPPAARSSCRPPRW